jgi:hypothetical protein
VLLLNNKQTGTYPPRPSDEWQIRGMEHIYQSGRMTDGGSTWTHPCSSSWHPFTDRNSVEIWCRYRSYCTQTHTHPSHSHTTRLLSTSLSLGIHSPTPPSVCEPFTSSGVFLLLQQHHVHTPIDKARANLDGKTGLVPGLVPGFQGWKCPGTLAQTWH